MTPGYHKGLEKAKRYVGAVVVQGHRIGKIIMGAIVGTNDNGSPGRILFLFDEMSSSTALTYKNMSDRYWTTIMWAKTPDDMYVRETDDDYIKQVYVWGCPLREKFLRERNQ